MKDWELVGEQELDDGGGPYNGFDFTSLDLDTTYLLSLKKLKGASGANVQCDIRFLVATAEALTSHGVVEYWGRGAALADSTARSIGGNTGSGIPSGGMSSTSDDLLDHSNTTYDDLDGQTGYILFSLPDQGTADDQGISFRGAMFGGFGDTSGTIPATGIHEQYGNIRSQDLPSQINGIRVTVPSGNFAENAGAKISLYKYTGSVSIQ